MCILNNITVQISKTAAYPFLCVTACGILRNKKTESASLQSLSVCTTLTFNIIRPQGHTSLHEVQHHAVQRLLSCKTPFIRRHCNTDKSCRSTHNDNNTVITRVRVSGIIPQRTESCKVLRCFSARYSPAVFCIFKIDLKPAFAIKSVFDSAITAVMRFK